MDDNQTLEELIVERLENVAAGKTRSFTIDELRAFCASFVRSRRDYLTKRGRLRRMKKRYDRLPKLGKVRYWALDEGLERWEDEQCRLWMLNDPECQALFADL